MDKTFEWILIFGGVIVGIVICYVMQETVRDEKELRKAEEWLEDSKKKDKS